MKTINCSRGKDPVVPARFKGDDANLRSFANASEGLQSVGLDAVFRAFLLTHPEFAEDLAKVRQEFPEDKQLLEFIAEEAPAYFMDVEIEEGPFIGRFTDDQVQETSVAFKDLVVTPEGHLALNFTVELSGDTTCFGRGSSTPMVGSSAWYGPDDQEELSVDVSLKYKGMLLFPPDVSALGDYIVSIDEQSKKIDWSSGFVDEGE